MCRCGVREFSARVNAVSIIAAAVGVRGGVENSQSVCRFVCWRRIETRDEPCQPTSPPASRAMHTAFNSDNDITQSFIIYSSCLSECWTLSTSQPTTKLSEFVSVDATYLIHFIETTDMVHEIQQFKLLKFIFK